MRQQTIQDVFIIESLSDVEARIAEGKALRTILRMVGMHPKYRMVQSRDDLISAADEFQQSGFRYLHISCHGNEEELVLARGRISFNDFASVFGGALLDRRIFLSACCVAQRSFATAVFKNPKTAPYSLTGPRTTIYFADVAVTWLSLYNLLFRRNIAALKGEHLRGTLNKICRLHGVRFTHFGRKKTGPYFTEYKLPQKKS